MEQEDVGKVIFQSTLLMRGATVSASLGSNQGTFQSTLLMRGATTSIRRVTS